MSLKTPQTNFPMDYNASEFDNFVSFLNFPYHTRKNYVFKRFVIEQFL